jgi:Na+-transporting methylmalonyl-CoA/oxaloacetate decarboxylase gamma subunit
MVDWGIIGRMWGGYGVNIIVLLILLLIAWVVGLVLRRRMETKESKENSKRG